MASALGLEAYGLGALSSGDAVARTLLGSVAAPIFDAGRIRQQIEIQNAVQEQAFINYQSTVLNALEEVENALVTLTNTQKRQENLRPKNGRRTYAMPLGPRVSPRCWLDTAIRLALSIFRRCWTRNAPYSPWKITSSPARPKTSPP